MQTYVYLNIIFLFRFMDVLRSFEIQIQYKNRLINSFDQIYFTIILYFIFADIKIKYDFRACKYIFLKYT